MIHENSGVFFVKRICRLGRCLSIKSIKSTNRLDSQNCFHSKNYTLHWWFSDYSINEIPLETELLVLIGGNSWHINSLEITNLIKNRLVAGKTVAAICGAVDFLAKNDLLNDKKHTGNSVYLWQSYEQYTNLSRFLEEQVVEDEPLITANGTATLEFINQVMKTVNALPVDQIDKITNLHNLGFYKYCDKFGNPYAQRMSLHLFMI